MNDETVKMLERQEEEHVKNAATLDDLLDVDDKEKSMRTLDKAQEIELRERKMKVEEDKLKLEYEKFQYQKEQDAKNRRLRYWEVGSNFFTTSANLGLGIWKLIDWAKTFGYCVQYENDGIWGGSTIRKFVSDKTSLRM